MNKIALKAFALWVVLSILALVAFMPAKNIVDIHEHPYLFLSLVCLFFGSIPFAFFIECVAYARDQRKTFN
jgi:hypothetical protein